MKASVITPDLKFDLRERIAFEVLNFPKTFTQLLQEDGDCVLLLWRKLIDYKDPAKKPCKIITGSCEAIATEFKLNLQCAMAPQRPTPSILFIVAGEKGHKGKEIKTVGGVFITDQMFSDAKNAAVTREEAEQAARQQAGHTKMEESAETAAGTTTRARVVTDANGNVDVQQTRQSVEAALREHLIERMNRADSDETRQGFVQAIERLGTAEGEQQIDQFTTMLIQTMQQSGQQAPPPSENGKQEES